MDELVPPVVTTKPARGREMQTTTIPTDMFDTMRMVSAKKTLGGEDMTSELQKPTEGTAEYYHEGYVDGKLYLVPDSNLEAMRDIINFKMRPRRSTRYKHQTSYELSDYDHFKGKLDGFFTKLATIEDLSNQSDENDSEPGNVGWEPKEKELERRSEEESEDKYDDYGREEDEDSGEKYENKDSEDDGEDLEEKSEDRDSTEELKQKSCIKFKEDADVNYLRFLVSGHFKKNQNPMFIIQEYNGKPDVFKNQKTDFFSKEKNDDVDVFISGKFYNENILEESQGKPVALMTKPDKIKIEMEKSKIYYDYFNEIYNMKNCDISFKGEFIRSKATNRITPFLTIGVENKAPNQKVSKVPEYQKKEKNTYNKSLPPTTVLVYKPQYDINPFSDDVGSIDNHESSAKEYLHHKKINKPTTETNPPLDENSSQQVATHFFSLSNMGEGLLGEAILDEPISKPDDRQYQPLTNNQSVALIMKRSEGAVPVPAETLNTNTPNTKKSLKEAVLKTLYKGSSMLKTIFEKQPSKDSLGIDRNTQKINVESTLSSENLQKTPTVEKKGLENNNDSTTKNKTKFFCHLF